MFLWFVFSEEFEEGEGGAGEAEEEEATHTSFISKGKTVSPPSRLHLHVLTAILPEVLSWQTCVFPSCS